MSSKTKGGVEVSVGYMRVYARLDENARRDLAQDLNASGAGDDAGKDYSEGFAASLKKTARQRAEAAFKTNEAEASDSGRRSGDNYVRGLLSAIRGRSPIRDVFRGSEKDSEESGLTAGQSFLAGLREGVRDGWDSRALFRKMKQDAADAGKVSSKAIAAELDKAEANVSRLSGSVETALGKQTDAAGRLRVAETALAEAKQKNADGSAKVVAAEERLAKARRDSNSAASSASRLEADYGAALARRDELLKRSTRSEDDNGNAIRRRLAAIASASKDISRINFGGTGIAALVSGIMSIVPAVVPATAALLGLAGAVGAMGVGMVAGLGVVMLAIKPVIEAVTAMGAAETAAGADAQAAAKAHASAARQVESAKRGVVDAQRAASDGVKAAIERQVAAEKSLTSAQKDAQRAQEDLVQARRDAIEQMKDLNRQVSEGALRQRGADISVREAQVRLTEVNTDPKATGLDRDRAQLSYDEAVANQKRVKEELADLAQKQRDSSRAGIDGNEGVKRAVEGVVAAQERVREAQENVKKSAQGVAQAQVEGARRVQEAQARVAEAQAALAESSNKASASQTKLNEAMGKLSPAGREFAAMLFSAKNGLEGLSKEAQQAMFPGLIQGLRDGSVHGRLFHDLLIDLSSRMGTLSADAGRAFAGPVWTGILDTFRRDMPVAMDQGFRATGNFLQGLSSLLAGLSPLFMSVSQSTLNLSQRFADWGDAVTKTQGFRDFLEYCKESMPRVGALLGAFGRAIVTLVRSLAPAGMAATDAATGFFNLIANAPPETIERLAKAIIGLTAGYAMLGPFTNGIKLLSLAFSMGPWGWAAAAIAAVAAGLGYLYQNNSGFRAWADGVLGSLKNGVVQGFNLAKEALRLFLDGWNNPDGVKSTGAAGQIQEAAKQVRKAWDDVATWAKPKMDQIRQIFQDAWTMIQVVVKTALDLILLAWNTFGGTLTQFVRDAWNGIQNIISGALNIIQGVIRLVTAVLKGDWSAAWEAIKQIVRGAWDVILGIVQTAGAALKGILSLLWNAITATVKAVWNGIWKALQDVWNNITRTITQETRNWRKVFGDAWDWISKKTSDVWNGIVRYFDGLKKTMAEKITGIVGGIKRAWEGVQKAFETPVNWVIDNVLNKLIQAWNAVMEHIDKSKKMQLLSRVGVTTTFVTAPGRTSGQQKYARGGIIAGAPAYGYDNRMALLDGHEPIHVGSGEYIINARAAQAFRPLLDQINFDLAPAFAPVRSSIEQAFAAGGPVWPTTSKRLSNNYSGHSGIDIPVPIGTPVFAAGPGAITYVGWGKGYGNAVFQSLPNGMQAVYGHNSQPLVKVGQPVTAGQVIARSGNTGRSSGPHVHFEVTGGGFANAGNRATTQAWLGGAALQGGGGGMSLNPLDWLRSLAGQAGSWILDKASGVVQGINGRFGNTGISNLLTGLSTNLIEQVKGFLQSQAPTDGDASSAFNGMSVPGTFNTWWAEALKVAGPGYAQYRRAAEIVAFHESGFRPGAINNYDRNARAGTPSAGLMQFIKPTFDDYAWPGHNNWSSPVDQLLAFFQYGQRRYGGIYNVPGVKSVLAGGKYRPYAEGGLVMPSLPTPKLYDTGGLLGPGTHIVENRTGGPEYILPRDITEGLLQGRGGAAPLVQIGTIETHDSTEVVGQIGFWAHHARHSRSNRFPSE